MSTTTESSLEIALGFYEAWTSKDLDKTMSFVADDVIVDSPSGRVEGVGDYRVAIEAWFKMFKRVELIDSFSQDDRAVMIYTCVTVPVAEVPAAEYFAIEDSKIAYKRLIFDRGPFMAAA